MGGISNNIFHGFIQLKRTSKLLNLIKKRPSAFVLLTLIALRARRTNSDEYLDNLKVGEALIGDYEKYGATEMIYRTDKKFLKKYKFATFTPTTEGTIAQLFDTSIFDVNEDNSTDKITNKQQSINGQETTNNNGNKDNNEKKNIYVEDKNKKEPGEQSEVVNDILEYFESTLKTKIVLRGRESKAIRDMLNVGYSENGIKNAIKYMHENDEYFKDKPFDLFDVARQMPRYKAQGEKIKAEREALNTEFTNKKPQVRYEEVKDERGRVINYKEVYSEE